MDLLWRWVEKKVDVPKAAFMSGGLATLNLFMLTNSQLTSRQEVFCRTITVWQKCHDRHSPSPGWPCDWSPGYLWAEQPASDSNASPFEREDSSCQDSWKADGRHYPWQRTDKENKAAAHGTLPLGLSQHEFTALYQDTAAPLLPVREASDYGLRVNSLCNALQVYSFNSHYPLHETNTHLRTSCNEEYS